MDGADLNNRFKWHQPRTQEVGETHDAIRRSCASLAHDLNDWVPEGREKSLAITKLEEVMMWANAGVARNGS